MKKFLALAMAVAMTLGVVGCGGTEEKPAEGENTEATEEGTEEKPVLKMGVSADFPPFESFDVDGTTIIGYDVDMMAEIADRLGMELEVKDMNFDTVVTAVQGGKLDVGATGITITPERLESVNFSEPYFSATQSILVPKDSAITGMADLAEGEAKAGVQLGTTGDIMASEVMGERVRQYEKFGDALAALMAGKIECMILDTGVAEAYAAANDLVVAGEFTTGDEVEQYGIAVAKENTELLDKINAELAEMKEEGFFDELNTKYFG